MATTEVYFLTCFRDTHRLITLVTLHHMDTHHMDTRKLLRHILPLPIHTPLRRVIHLQEHTMATDPTVIWHRYLPVVLLLQLVRMALINSLMATMVTVITTTIIMAIMVIMIIMIIMNIMVVIMVITDSACITAMAIMVTMACSIIENLGSGNNLQ